MTRWLWLVSLALLMSMLMSMLMGCADQQHKTDDRASDAMRPRSAAPLPDRQAPSIPITAAPTTQLPIEFAAAVEFARTMGTLLARHQRAVQIAMASRNASAMNDNSVVTEQIDGEGTIQVNFVRGIFFRGTLDRGILVRGSVIGGNAHPGRTNAASVTPLQVDASIRVFNASSVREVVAVRAGLPRRLTEFESAKLRARRTALDAASTADCCRRNATAVLISWRRNAADVFYAYVFGAAQPRACDPTVEVVVSGNGANVVALRALTGQCAQQDAGDESALSVITTTRATPAPTDVFLALRLGRPVHLHTKINGLTWRIDGERIALLDRSLDARDCARDPTANNEYCAH